MVSGEIAEDFSAYFLTSEQRPTAVALGVKIGTDGKCLGAGGVFLQPLPGADEKTLIRTETEIMKFPNLSSLIQEKGAEGVLRGIENADYYEKEVRYRCFCSREKTESLVIALGKEDAQSLVKERGNISVHCHYCNTDYEFDEAAVSALFAAKEGK